MKTNNDKPILVQESKGLIVVVLVVVVVGWSKEVSFLSE